MRQEQQDQHPKTNNDDEHDDEIDYLGLAPARTMGVYFSETV